MNPEMLGMAGGAAGGGILSDALHALGAPRRALWSMLGAPEKGSDLISQLTGMDPNGGMSQVLGFGAEMLLDPMTYAGGLLGRGIGGYLARDAEKMNAVRQDLAAVQDAKAASEAAVASHSSELAQWEAQSAAAQAQHAKELAAYQSSADAAHAAHAGDMASYGQQMSDYNRIQGKMSHASVGYNPQVSEMLPGLEDMGGLAKRSVNPELPFHKGGLSYKRFSPDAAGTLDQLNLGQQMPSGLLQMNTVDKPPFLLGTGGYLRNGGNAPSHLLESLGGGAADIEGQSAILREALQGGKSPDALLMGMSRPTRPSFAGVGPAPAAPEIGSAPMQSTLRDVLASEPQKYANMLKNPPGMLDLQAQQALPMLDDSLSRGNSLLERLGLSPMDIAAIGGTAGGVFGAGLQNFNRR